MTKYKCAYCKETFEIDTQDEEVETTVPGAERPTFQRPSDFHTEFREHVRKMHLRQPVLRIRVS